MFSTTLLRRGVRWTLVFAALASTSAQAIAATDCLIWPVSPTDWNSQGKQGGACRISSPYAIRNLGGVVKMHQGIDLSCKEGTSIRAPVSGTATHASYPAGGNHVVIISSPGIDGRLGTKAHIDFLHNRQWTITHGQPVSPGDMIAKMGNEGHSTGAHLHLQVIAANPRKSIDPGTLACPGTWPAAGPLDSPNDPGVIQAASSESSDDAQGTSLYAMPGPNEIPPPPPAGLGEDSSRGNLQADIMSRAFNVEYTIQLATLGPVSLLREISYLEALSARIALLRERSQERKNSIKAALTGLHSQSLKKEIDAQHKNATSRGNSAGTAR